jgi:energy-coupling factor transporter ATP-binding protein EcfA2
MSTLSTPTTKSYQCMEQILKDFLAYVVYVKQSFIRKHHDASTFVSAFNAVDGGDKKGRLEWSLEEADRHRESIKFFGRAMGKQMHRMPKENKVIRRTLEQMKLAIREGLGQEDVHNPEHVHLLIEAITKLLRFLQPIDLERLIELMKINQIAGDKMDGKEVILLLGSVGSGKTTTLHVMAGTSFVETEEDGFSHLQPNSFLDPNVSGYTTSYARDATTKALQTVQVSIDGRNFVVCDTPGLGDIEDFEQELANGLGIVRALHRARSVRPVLVLSREGMGDRFSDFSETIRSFTRLIGKPTAVHLKPMNYIFTKYEKRHRNLLCRQFILMKKRPRGDAEEADIFRMFVDDIIQKTTPVAQVALPMEDGPHTLLHSILMERFCVLQPREYFVPSVSDAALRKLKLQLQIILRDVVTSLSEDDYAFAEYRMDQLTRLAVVLPEAVECTQLGLEATLRRISVARVRVTNINNNIPHVKAHKQFADLLAMFRTEVQKTMATESLRNICERFERDSHSITRRTPIAGDTFCNDHIQQLINFVSRGIPDFDSTEYAMTERAEQLMKTRASFLTGVVRLKEMSEILVDIPGAELVKSTYNKSFDKFYTFVDSVLTNAEGSGFPTSSPDFLRFERQAWFLAVLIQGFLNKPDSGTGEHAKMEELENRRLKLMLRLEIKISDTLDVVANTRFPDGREEDSSPASLPIVKLSGLRAHRALLHEVSQLSRLCKFLPTKIDCAEIEKSVAVLDRKVVNFLRCTIAKAESIFNRLDAMRTQQELSAAIRSAIAVRHDLQLVIEEFAAARGWSREIEERTTDDWERLLIVQEAVEASIQAMEDSITARQNAELGFACGMLSPKYLCARKTIKE